MNRIKILCIDDEMNILESLQRTLRSKYDVVAFSDPYKALQELELNPDFDLIICDFKMPQISGEAVLKKASELYPDIGRILVSADIESDYLMRGFNQLHFHKLILKPWDPDYLKHQIHEALLLNKTLIEKRKYEILSKIDNVTGLFNHRHFQTELARHITKPHRSVGLLLADIDFFKSFNDQYGHLEGDLILREVAQRLKLASPSNGLTFRYGGEEFAIIAPDIKDSQLEIISEKIRKSVSDTPIQSRLGQNLQVTLSLGATLIQDSTSCEEAIQAADEALYQAKDKGRNRVEILKLAT